MKIYNPTARLIVSSKDGSKLITGIVKLKPAIHDVNKTYVRVRETFAGKLADKLYSFYINNSEIKNSKWDECKYFNVNEDKVRIGNC